MSSGQDLTAELSERVSQARSNRTKLEIVGGQSKRFFGRLATGERLDLSAHQGILTYEPSELVVTARAGTALATVEQTLAGQGQMLPFEPPWFGENATIGGTLGCGLSGPRRPYAGSLRDYVLGVRIVNGRGEVLRFGGEVMKNVAGYDVSRLMAGALGTLGIVLEVSFKVLPRPEQEITLSRDCDPAHAIDEMNRWAGRPLPLSAACFDGQRLHIRLSGSPKAVAAARSRIGGEMRDDADQLWIGLREHRLSFFDPDRPLWRLSLPSSTQPLALGGKQFIDWGGAQRWLISAADPDRIRSTVERAGGHATLFRGGQREQEVFHPLPGPIMGLHKRLKQTFDPEGIFNPGRLYRDL